MNESPDITMIDTSEIDQKATEFGLGAAAVEKDYVHGRVLHALYAVSPLGSQLVLKGGNCLRKAIFPIQDSPRTLISHLLKVLMNHS
jgi:predicted nucleotidyltransferase component of viral defense system